MLKHWISVERYLFKSAGGSFNAVVLPVYLLGQLWGFPYNILDLFIAQYGKKMLSAKNSS